MLNMDREKFSGAIELSAKKAFLDVIEKSSINDICGCALYSDTGAMTICLAINTEENLSSLSNKYPDDALAFKWSPNEWAHEFTDHDALSEVSDEARRLIETSKTAQSFRETRDFIYESCVTALERLATSGFFSQIAPKSIVVFSVFGLEGEKDSEISWIKRLNNDVDASEFSNWLNSLEDE